jgi:hypothetical protein
MINPRLPRASLIARAYAEVMELARGWPASFRPPGVFDNERPVGLLLSHEMQRFAQ